jgi:hypothetical protein
MPSKFSLREGGAPPKFLIIDDGWQEIVNEFKDVDEALLEQTVYAFQPLQVHKLCAPYLISS